MNNAVSINRFPLTQNQMAIWLDEVLYPNSGMYNLGFQYEIKGELHIDLLRQALKRVVAENEALGTSIEIGENGQPFQTFIPQLNYELPIYDFSKKDPQVIKTWKETYLLKGFDLNQSPFYDFALLKLDEHHFIWIMKIHHIIIDGKGFFLLVEQVSAYYNALLGLNIPVEKQLFSFQAAIQEDLVYRQSDQFQKDKNYWKNKFQKLPLSIRILTTPQKTKGTIQPVLKRTWRIPRTLYSQIESYSKVQEVSVFHFWMGVLATYFYKTISNQEEQSLCIGMPLANRNNRKTKNTIGLYTGTLPLLIDINSDLTFEKLIKQVRSTIRKDYRYRNLPMQEVSRFLHHLTLGERNLFEVTFSYLKQNGNFSLGDTAIETTFLKGLESKNPFDVLLVDYPAEDHVYLNFHFLNTYFPKEEVESIISRLETLVRDILKNTQTSNNTIPKLNILPKNERKLILETFNHSTSSYPNTDSYQNKTIVDLFEEQVQKTPNNTAVHFENNKLTYKELDKKSSQLAYYLQDKYKIEGDDIIAIQLERSEWMIIAILGVLKSGAAYLPIGSNLPAARVYFMLKDSQTKAILTDNLTFKIAQQFNISTENIENIDLGKTDRQPLAVNRLLSLTLFTLLVQQVNQKV